VESLSWKGFQPAVKIRSNGLGCKKIMVKKSAKSRKIFLNWENHGK